MPADKLPKDSPFAENTNDAWARNYRVGLPVALSLAGPLGAIAGPILGEIIASTIPSQRLDRMALYLEKVRRVFPDEKLDRIINDLDRLGLLEEGLYAASFSTQRTRTERIASIVVNGLKKDDLDLDRATHLLNIVKGLSDADIVILHRYKLVTARDGFGLRDFDKAHQDLIPHTIQGYGLNEQARAVLAAKESLFKSHVNILYSAGLLEEQKRQKLPAMPRSMRGGISETAVASYVADIANRITEQNYKISSLGKELIESLTLPDEGDDTATSD